MAGDDLPDADYILNYADVIAAYRDITPERFRLLATLQRLGTISIYALAKALERNYSNVHADVGALLDLDLIGSHTGRGVRSLGGGGMAAEHGGQGSVRRLWRGFQFLRQGQVKQPGLLFHFGQQFLDMSFAPFSGELAEESTFQERHPKFFQPVTNFGTLNI